ncbi:MAG TPA: SIS domain-containing protein [Nitrososphaerales archaeon]|nr:SIS domain-containing protein [Nitrososphaerales archaeon]
MARNPMRTFAREVESQPGILLKFSKSNFPKARRGSIFVGAGDSYSAALAGFHASNGWCIAVDPYHLASSPDVARGKDVFLISVSGRTASNLAAARKVRNLARRTVAITSNKGSRLAGLVDQVVGLPVGYLPRTPGLLSYSLSLLAVLSIAGCRDKCDFEGALRAARKDEGKIRWGGGTTFFLGNSLAYPVAMYAAAKTYEFIGARAQPQLLEEFSHLELFSLGPSDVVNVFSAFDPLGASGRLANALAHQGYESHKVPSGRGSRTERLFHAVFASQLSVLRRAGELRLSEPNFLGAADKLTVSDSMIY